MEIFLPFSFVFVDQSFPFTILSTAEKTGSEADDENGIFTSASLHIDQANSRYSVTLLHLSPFSSKTMLVVLLGGVFRRQRQGRV
jgi:hypothetical protein